MQGAYHSRAFFFLAKDIPYAEESAAVKIALPGYSEICCLEAKSETVTKRETTFTQGGGGNTYTRNHLAQAENES